MRAPREVGPSPTRAFLRRNESTVAIATVAATLAGFMALSVTSPGSDPKAAKPVTPTQATPKPKPARVKPGHTEVVDIARTPSGPVHVRDVETTVVTLHEADGPTRDARVSIDLGGLETGNMTPWGTSHAVPAGQSCRLVNVNSIGCGPMAAGETKAFTFQAIPTGFPAPHLYWKAYGTTTELGLNEDLAGG